MGRAALQRRARPAARRRRVPGPPPPARRAACAPDPGLHGGRRLDGHAEELAAPARASGVDERHPCQRRLRGAAARQAAGQPARSRRRVGAAGLPDRSEPRRRAGPLSRGAQSGHRFGARHAGNTGPRPACGVLSGPADGALGGKARGPRPARGAIEHLQGRRVLRELPGRSGRPAAGIGDAGASRSDGIVDWKACLDPHAQRVHVNSSHCGMSVHREVYEVLDRVLDESGEAAWSG